MCNNIKQCWVGAQYGVDNQHCKHIHMCTCRDKVNVAKGHNYSHTRHSCIVVHTYYHEILVATVYEY